jgi:hypothetical protein
MLFVAHAQHSILLPITQNLPVRRDQLFEHFYTLQGARAGKTVDVHDKENQVVGMNSSVEA